MVDIISWLLIPWVLAVIVIWEAVWKGIALWYSARAKHLVWFICILIFNTIGILPIVYLLFFKKTKITRTVKAKPRRTKRKR
ncbi:MAG: hypothetical protein KJ767_00145 [Nanoarchaeota archaeon]|nr:hypothetical protein [Nanoarchaeota archaeon]